ncbi:transmembrane adaptor Erv26 [Lipomyces japonicus]|uniref:transmembrane adaptor Erv26 n=1 Tax=Lipomyces japonicus TaxID=56871 RepID=UPI0034CFD81A
MILTLLSYLGIIVGFVFLTLAIAAGLYYLSELVEEHSRFTKQLLEKLIYGIIIVHLLLFLIDKFPFWLTVFGIVTQVVYLQNLKQFPFIQLTSPIFISSCVLVLLNHYFWFQFFSRPSIPPPSLRYSSSLYEPQSSLPSFAEVSSFFGICVWLVPFALFVSLSAGDNVLPSSSIESSSSAAGRPFGSENANTTLRKGQGLAKVVINKVKEGVEEVARVIGWGDSRQSASGRIV